MLGVGKKELAAVKKSARERERVEGQKPRPFVFGGVSFGCAAGDYSSARRTRSNDGNPMA